jgi:fructokinase
LGFDVTALGELLIDFTPDGTNSRGIALYARNPGGAPANVLAMITKLGGRTAFIGKVGKDAFGDYLRETLVSAGIDVSGLMTDREYPTTLAFVNLDKNGDRSFSFYRKPGADLLLTPEEIKKDLIDEARIFHFGSVSLSGEPCRQTVHEAVAYARTKGKIVSFDPNYRPLLWDSEESARREILRLVPQADILKVSEEEMLLLTGLPPAKADDRDARLALFEKGAAALSAMGPVTVLVSLGADGAFYRCPKGSGHLATYDVKTVDTTGAGDAFLGAILWKLREKSREDLRQMEPAELAAITDFGNAAGSLTTMVKGAIPALPEAAAIEAFTSKI